MTERGSEPAPAAAPGSSFPPFFQYDAPKEWRAIDFISDLHLSEALTVAGNLELVYYAAGLPVDHAAITAALQALGVARAGLAAAHQAEIDRGARSLGEIETALEGNFQQLFVNAMAMPNKADPFPKLASVVNLPARKWLRMVRHYKPEAQPEPR